MLILVCRLLVQWDANNAIVVIVRCLQGNRIALSVALCESYVVDICNKEQQHQQQHQLLAIIIIIIDIGLD